ncbi:MAG: flagellar basal body-associated FliL family protein [Alphaproteobacteria bacterium]
MLRKFVLLSFLFSAVFTLNAHDAYAGGGAKKEGGSALEFVKMEPLLLPIIDEDGIQQVVSMVLSIEVEGVSDADKVKAMKPRLTDAYITDMYGVLNKHAALKGGVIQVAMIKERLNEITHDVLGDDISAEVLIQVVQQRPI